MNLRHRRVLTNLADGILRHCRFAGDLIPLFSSFSLSIHFPLFVSQILEKKKKNSMETHVENIPEREYEAIKKKTFLLPVSMRRTVQPFQCYF